MWRGKKAWGVFVLIMAGIVCCLAGITQAQKFGEISDDEWNAAPPEDYPEAKAIVLFDNGELSIKISRKISLDRHVRIKIFQKEGADDALTVEIPYIKGDDIQRLKAHTITPDGEKHEIKDWYNKKAGEYYLRTGTFPSVEDGSILEYTYRQKHERYHHIDPWYFQSELYTKKSRVKVIMDPGFTYNVEKRCIPFTQRDPVSEEVRDEMQYTWELDNLLPAKEEPLSCAREEYLSSLHFQLKSFEYGGETYSYIKSWADLGETLDEYYTSFIDDSALIAGLADSLCDGMTEPDDKIRSLHDFVQNEIKTGEGTVEDDDEEWGYSVMIANGYAPPSRKNTMLAALLCTQDIPACPLLIGTRDEHTVFNPASQHLTQFNRTLCCIKHDRTYQLLDPGEEGVPYPYLPAIDLVEGGLLIQGDSSKPINIQHPTRRSGIDVMSEMHLHADGTASCSATVYIRGYEMAPYYDMLEDTAQDEKIVAALLKDKALTTYDVSWSQVMYSEEDDYIQVDMTLELNELATALDDNLFFSPCLVPIMKNPFKTDRRLLPVDFQYTQSRRHRLRVIFPDGYQVADLPQEIVWQIDGVKFNRTLRYDETGIDVAVNLILERPYFQVAEYADIKELFDAMAASTADQIALTPIAETEPPVQGGAE